MTSHALEQKVRAVLRADDTGPGPYGRCGEQPVRREGEHLTPWELALRDWGIAYGIAFGIARDEGSFESVESVAQRTFDAAWPVYQLNGGFGERPIVIGSTTDIDASSQARNALADLIAERISGGPETR